jgi:response regulator RpfG family c-di-GMP phosphodiesterase
MEGKKRMNSARLSASQDVLVVRDEIATALYAGVPRDGQTLIVRLLAPSFADEYAGAISEGRAPAVAAWAEEMCAKPGRAAAVARLLEAAQKLGTDLSERGVPERYLAGLPALAELSQAVAVSERAARHQTAHLDEIDAAIAESLAKLDAVDPRSAALARSVSSWCARLARRLGLASEDVTFVTRCGWLHVIGFETNALLAPFAKKNDAHPRAAEIVAVAARFSEALTGDAAHAPLRPEAAVDEVGADAGTRYDPEVVAALRELVATG